MSPARSSERVSERASSGERIAVIEWAARMGAVTAKALAERERSNLSSARARLACAERDGMLASTQVLQGSPPLYTATRAGLRAAGLAALGPCRVSAANAAHLAVCASVAAALERRYPDHRVGGERELRRDERELHAALASARVRARGAAGGVWHRPDLVLWPERGESLPTAIEVELTVKAPLRLQEICRAWARARCVAGALYLAPPRVADALERAIARVQASDRVIVAPLEAVLESRVADVAAGAHRRTREPSQGLRYGVRWGVDQLVKGDLRMPYNSLNRVIVIGRLTRDPELRSTPSGTSVCGLRLACNSSRKDADGVYSERPNYFDVSVFGTPGENVAQYMRKGSRVGVDGRLEWREWESSGEKRQAVSIVADTVQFLDSAGDSQEGGEDVDGDLVASGAGEGDIAF